MTCLPDTGSSLFVLAKRSGVEIDSIKKAWGEALHLKQELKAKIAASGILTGGEESDRSLVVFGSLARNEFTGQGKSDVDWTLLVDGIAAIQDINLVHALRHLIEESGHKEPTKAGPFGNLAFSHDLIHQIGGADDTNVNTTQRLLLLLESSSLYGDAVRRRVIRNVLSRYLLEDESFLTGKHTEHVPRFLLNDVARYWRTMTVDFQNKMREREKIGFALRNVKLRFSRKLLYLSGLITCFSFNIWKDDGDLDAAWNRDLSDPERGLRLVSWLEARANTPPLELVSSALLKLGLVGEPSHKLLSSYNEFLRLLSDAENRRHLEHMLPEAMAKDTVYQSARQASHDFQDAIEKLFLEPGKSVLSDLTIRYGVF